jgi:ABC-type transport system involved in multi-copper enzyme maturation permease subunit
MNPLSEISLIVQRELRKNLRSVKGIILTALSIVGGTGTALLFVQAFHRKFVNLSAEELRLGQQELFTEIYKDPVMGSYMSTAPLSLVVMLELTIWLAPLLVALSSFDAISGDIQHRTVRYWTVRTRRVSYYAGKFLGVWATVGTIVLAMDVCMWVAAIIKGEPAGATLSWGIRFWLVSLPIAAVWCAIATFVGSLFRTPILSLLVTLGSFFTVWLFGFAIARGAEIQWLMYVYPNRYDAMLLSPRVEAVGGGLGICLGAAAILTAAGVALFQKRDI